MSVKAMAWVFERSQSQGSDRLVLLALADRADESGHCWPGITEIAKKAKVSERTVQRSISALASLHELLIPCRAGGKHSQTNRYQILMHGCQFVTRTGDTQGAGRVTRVSPNTPDNPSDGLTDLNEEFKNQSVSPEIHDSPVARTLHEQGIQTDAAGVLRVLSVGRAAAVKQGGTVTDEQVADICRAIIAAAPQRGRGIRSVSYIVRSLPGRVAMVLPYLVEQEQQERERQAILKRQHIDTLRQLSESTEIPEDDRRHYHARLEQLQAEAGD